jgi:hypothetical protein
MLVALATTVTTMLEPLTIVPRLHVNFGAA